MLFINMLVWFKDWIQTIFGVKNIGYIFITLKHYRALRIHPLSLCIKCMLFYLLKVFLVYYDMTVES